MANIAFNWCFIGAGKLAEKVAKEITASGAHKVVSVYARRKEQREAFAKKYHAVAYADAKEAMLDENVDGVYIVTPHNSHYEYAKLALELGKPVLCEKPFVMNHKQAEELMQLAKDKDVYLAEAMWTWFSPIARQVKTWLRQGAFGEIEELTIRYHQTLCDRGGRLTDPSRAGGALLDIGVYPITYLYRLFGMPAALTCCGDVRDGIDYAEEVTMAFANGASYTASISFQDDEGGEVLSIKGTNASLELPMFHYADEVTLVEKNGQTETFRSDGSMLNEFNLVAREIWEGKKESHYVSHQATLDVMKLLDMCREQMGLIYPFEKSVILAEDQLVLERCLAIRNQVFTVDMGIAKDIEVDAYDDSWNCCDHFLITYNNQDVGAFRCQQQGDSVQIQRFCVLKEYRKLGLGRLALEYIEAYYNKQEKKMLTLDAKYHVSEFYEKCGFYKASDVFIEADVPHLKMVKYVK